MKVDHAPLVLNNSSLVKWNENTTNISSISINYGFSCIDGIYLSYNGEALHIIDLGAHLARHIFNSLSTLKNLDLSEKLGVVSEEEGLEKTIEIGRSGNFSNFPLKLAIGKIEIGLSEYFNLFIKTLFLY